MFHCRKSFTALPIFHAGEFLVAGGRVGEYFGFLAVVNGQFSMTAEVRLICLKALGFKTESRLDVSGRKGRNTEALVDFVADLGRNPRPWASRQK